eukprot:jgi/Pico_ML_1/51027/g2131.t1
MDQKGGSNLPVMTSAQLKQLYASISQDSGRVQLCIEKARVAAPPARVDPPPAVRGRTAAPASFSAARERVSQASGTSTDSPRLPSAPASLGRALCTLDKDTRADGVASIGTGTASSTGVRTA